MKLPVSKLEMVMTTADSSVPLFNETGTAGDYIIKTVTSTGSPNIYENVPNQWMMGPTGPVGPVGPMGPPGQSGINDSENIMIQVNALRSEVNYIKSLLVELIKKIDNYHKDEFKFPD